MAPYFAYWGKTNRAADIDALRHHALPYHNLDVAAAGQALLERLPLLRKRLATRLGLSENAVTTLVPALLVLHDVGKFSTVHFQGKAPALASRLLGREIARTDPATEVYHTTAGYRFWTDRLRNRFHADGVLGLGATEATADEEDAWDLVEPLVQAVTGHHGTPPETYTLHVASVFGPDDEAAALAFARDALPVVAPSARPLAEWTEYDGAFHAVRRASWLLAGLAVAADWLGSDPHYFPFQTKPEDLEAYWERAKEQADKAVAASGLAPCRPSPVPPTPRGHVGALFPDLLGLDGFEPTPLQEHAATCPLADGPRLVLLEDATGSGKTEAAAVLAHRLLDRTPDVDAAPEGRGATVFVGLPTQATADRMHGRWAKAYRHLFAEGQRPSIVLAHGARDQAPGFQDTIRLAGADADPAETEGEPKPGAPADASGRAECAAWLADNRKAALLASVGVGTLDQALLGVLPARHQSLRLLGLGRAVFVADEVHAYDAYTSTLLHALLAVHAALGGSAVVLTATLPRAQRQALADAFRSGLPDADGPAAVSSDAFPLATHVSAAGAEEVPIDPAPGSDRAVYVAFVDKSDDAEGGKATEESLPDAALNVPLDAARAGGCAVWVRNTVADTRRAWRAARARFSADPGLDPDRLTLLHARFARRDRRAVEEQLEAWFGPDSTPADRAGRVLIATQVVEQSLDLDFDAMVTDLAPVDLLVQRAGRLHRHRRDAHGARLPDRAGDDGRLPPTLHVVAPPWSDAPPAAWYKTPFPKAAYVYPHASQLWRTAKRLRDLGDTADERVLPPSPRDLIEPVYAEAEDDHFVPVPPPEKGMAWTKRRTRPSPR